MALAPLTRGFAGTSLADKALTVQACSQPLAPSLSQLGPATVSQPFTGGKDCGAWFLSHFFQALSWTGFPKAFIFPFGIRHGVFPGVSDQHEGQVIFYSLATYKSLEMAT